MTSWRAMLVSGALLLSAPAAMAIDLPPEGDFDVTYYNILGASKAVPSAENKTASIIEFTQIVTNDSGGGFLHHATGRCVFTTVGNPTGAQNSGYCARVDADGDTIFSTFTGTRNGAESKGSTKYYGGTGKYVSLSGSSDYVAAPLKVLDKDSMPIIMGHSHGHYRLQSAKSQSESSR